MIKSKILLVGIFLVVLIVAVIGFTRHSSAPIVSPTVSSTVSISPSSSATPTSTTKPSVSVKPGQTPPIQESDYSKLLRQLGSTPATCVLKGGVDFLQPHLYDNKDSMFTYKGIDHEARLITWTVVPNDSLEIGPNLFNKLPLPDGKSLLSISLPNNPISKHYDLYAKVNYARLVNGDVKIMTASCAGKVTVDLKY